MLLRMDDTELLDRLRLIRTNHIRPITCQLLLRRYGSPLDLRSQGTNGLIRDGATLVQYVDDVLTILAQASRVEAPPAEPYQIPPAQLVPLSEKQRGEIHKKLLENISHDPIAVDELCRWCHVSADIV